MPASRDELAVVIKAVEDYRQVFEQFKSSLHGVETQQKRVSEATKQSSAATRDFLQVIGSTAAIYGMKRALDDLADTGGYVVESMQRVMAISGDTIDVMQMATEVLLTSTGDRRYDQYGPGQQADALQELTAAGLDTAQALTVLHEAQTLASAGLVSLGDAITPTLNIIKAYQLEASEAAHISDVFVTAAHRTALQVDDLTYSIASGASAAKLANQDYETLVVILGMLRDAGISAQRAGTTVRSALISLINPSEEAKQVMKDLGIEIYDASGQMKDWADIIAEFERGLADLDDQSRQYVLTTVASTYGLQALTISLDRGSDFIRDFANELREADGEAKSVAATMADTFAAASRSLEGNIERLKTRAFQSLQDGLTDLIVGFDAIVRGMNDADEGTRSLIVTLVGGAGLTVAIAAVTRAVSTLAQTLGASSAAAGPIGLVTAAIALLSTTIVATYGHMERARIEARLHADAVLDVASAYDDLTRRLSDVNVPTEEKERLSEQLRGTLDEIARIMPGVVEQWDAEGRAISINNDLLREYIELQREARRADTEKQLGEAQREATRARRDAASIQQGRAAAQRQLQFLIDNDIIARMQAGDEWAADQYAYALSEIFRQAGTSALPAGISLEQLVAGGSVDPLFQALEAEARRAQMDAAAEVRRLETMLGLRKDITDRDEPWLINNLVRRAVGSTAGTQTYLGPDGGVGGAGKSPEDILTEELRKAYRTQERLSMEHWDRQLADVRDHYKERLDLVRRESEAELQIREQLRELDRQAAAEAIEEQDAQFRRSLERIRSDIAAVKAEADREIQRLQSQRVVEVIAGQRTLTFDRQAVAEVERRRDSRIEDLQQREADLLEQRQKQLRDRERAEMREMMQMALEYHASRRSAEMEYLAEQQATLERHLNERRALEQRGWEVLRDQDVVAAQARIAVQRGMYQEMLAMARGYVDEVRRIMAEAAYPAFGGDVRSGLPMWRDPALLMSGALDRR